MKKMVREYAVQYRTAGGSWTPLNPHWTQSTYRIELALSQANRMDYQLNAKFQRRVISRLVSEPTVMMELETGNSFNLNLDTRKLFKE